LFYKDKFQKQKGDIDMSCKVNTLKQFLIQHPEISSLIIAQGIAFNGDDYMSILSSYSKDGFKVTASVDDDDMDENEKLKHHEALAEEALKILYSQMMKGR